MSTPNNKEHVEFTCHVLHNFNIEVTEEEKALLLSLPTEERVDRWKMNKIKSSWEEEEKEKTVEPAKKKRRKKAV